ERHRDRARERDGRELDLFGRLARQAAGLLEATREEQMEALVADAVAAVEGTERLERARPIAGLLLELAARRDLRRLAVEAARRALPDDGVDGVAVHAFEHDAAVVEH